MSSPLHEHEAFLATVQLRWQIEDFLTAVLPKLCLQVEVKNKKLGYFAVNAFGFGMCHNVEIFF